MKKMLAATGRAYGKVNML